MGALDGGDTDMGWKIWGQDKCGVVALGADYHCPGQRRSTSSTLGTGAVRRWAMRFDVHSRTFGGNGRVGPQSFT